VPYLGGGGGGLGVPVVSYAPRPMLLDSDSLKIMLLMSVLSSALYVSKPFHNKFKYRSFRLTYELRKPACQRRLNNRPVRGRPKRYRRE
jgi:hypothetical protein